MSAAGRTPGRAAIATTGITHSRQNSTIRMAAARAESWLDSGDELEFDEVSTEFDDAPPMDDVPEWEFEDNDPLVLGDDVRPWEFDTGGRPPWVRLSIFINVDGILDYQVHRRVSGDPEVDRSLAEVWSKWEKLGTTLIRDQAASLRCTTLKDALFALEPFAMRDLENSVGQGSRDRPDIIEAPFGLVPLWFFGMGRLLKANVMLLQDLIDTAHAVLDEGWDRVTEGRIRQALPRAKTKPDTIRKRHGETLMTVLQHPDTVARHQGRWPRTSLEALQADLEAKGCAATSEAVRVLALVCLLPTSGKSGKTTYGRDALPAEFRDQEER